jgi:hypothetical protein
MGVIRWAVFLGALGCSSPREVPSSKLPMLATSRNTTTTLPGRVDPVAPAVDGNSRGAALACQAFAGTAGSIAEVPDAALITAAIPDAATAARMTLKLDPQGAWRDCHGKPGTRDFKPGALVEVRVMERLPVDERHMHALLRVGDDALIASLTFENGAVTAHATEPVITHGGAPLRRTRLGDEEVVWFRRGDDVRIDLDMQGATVSGTGTVWEGHGSRGTDDYQTSGRVVERFRGQTCVMAVGAEWTVVKDEIVTVESWSAPSGPAARSGNAACAGTDRERATFSARRAYRTTTHGGESRRVPLGP